MSKILIINPILYTAETNRIPKVSSIKDTMIYALCMGFVHGEIGRASCRERV